MPSGGVVRGGVAEGAGGHHDRVPLISPDQSRPDRSRLELLARRWSVLVKSDIYCVVCRPAVHGHRHSLRASLSATFLSPNSARFGYATAEGALFISAQLSTDAASALRKVWTLITLPAPLSGTFLQTLPDLVTPLKGHSLSPRTCPPTRSAPSERFGY